MCGLTRLRVLDVEGCEGLTAACLTSLAPLTHLTHLNLGQCAALKGNKLNHIAGEGEDELPGSSIKGHSSTCLPRAVMSYVLVYSERASKGPSCVYVLKGEGESRCHNVFAKKGMQARDTCVY